MCHFHKHDGWPDDPADHIDLYDTYSVILLLPIPTQRKESCTVPIGNYDDMYCEISRCNCAAVLTLLDWSKMINIVIRRSQSFSPVSQYPTVTV